MADVLIAGGGMAGCSLAIMLGRAGLHVELFERARVSREKPCGEGLMPGGVSVLDKLGITDAVGGAPICGIRYYCGGKTAEAKFPRLAGFGRTGRGQRRKLLDHVLWSEAKATPGVRVHAETRVEAPLLEKGRVTGLAVEGQKIHAPLVVAADGMHSPIRHKLGLNRAGVDHRRFGMRAHFRQPSDRDAIPWVEIFAGCGSEIYVTPLPDNEVTVAVLSDNTGGECGRAEFRQCCEAFPAVAARLDGAEQISAVAGAAPLSGGAGAGVAAGVVLLGDAAGFSDPVTGGGMSQALLTAELLAGYISRNRAGDDRWLWSFEAERQRMLRDYRLLTRAVLRLSRRPRMTRAAISFLRRWPNVLAHGLAVAGSTKSLLDFS